MKRSVDPSSIQTILVASPLAPPEPPPVAPVCFGGDQLITWGGRCGIVVAQFGHPLLGFS